MKPISILAGAFAALSLSFSAASADTRAIYTISNISVDEEAQNTRQAEAEAFATAKVEGLQRLVRKITLPEDRDGIGNSFYSYATANELASAVDVDNEKRSSTVYRADLSVVFNPVRVRSRLQQLGVPYVDRQSPPSLIVPVSEDNAELEDWREAWPRADRGPSGRSVSPKRRRKGPYVQRARTRYMRWHPAPCRQGTSQHRPGTGCV